MGKKRGEKKGEEGRKGEKEKKKPPTRFGYIHVNMIFPIHITNWTQPGDREISAEDMCASQIATDLLHLLGLSRTQAWARQLDGWAEDHGYLSLAVPASIQLSW